MFSFSKLFCHHFSRNRPLYICLYLLFQKNCKLPVFPEAIDTMYLHLFKAWLLFYSSVSSRWTLINGKSLCVLLYGGLSDLQGAVRFGTCPLGHSLHYTPQPCCVQSMCWQKQRSSISSALGLCFWDASDHPAGQLCLLCVIPGITPHCLAVSAGFYAYKWNPELREICLPAGILSGVTAQVTELLCSLIHWDSWDACLLGRQKAMKYDLGNNFSAVFFHNICHSLEQSIETFEPFRQLEAPSSAANILAWPHDKHSFLRYLPRTSEKCFRQVMWQVITWLSWWW